MTDAGELKPVGWTWEREGYAFGWIARLGFEKPEKSELIRNIQPLYTRPATDNAHAVSEAMDDDEIIDQIEDAISDSFDVDWQPRDGARHVLGLLRNPEFQAALSQPTRTEAEASTERGELVERLEQAKTELWRQREKAESRIDFVISALRNHEGPRTDADIRAEAFEEAEIDAIKLAHQHVREACPGRITWAENIRRVHDKIRALKQKDTDA